ncbi:MAG TPA: hypothetical protein VLB84_13120 [Bacteroidia bacterium]|nr:hypothetical protein [Bacteroidia bacterium]
MEIVRCPQCKGAKELIGLGSVKEKCPTCNGKGVGKRKEKPITPIIMDEPAPASQAEVIKLLDQMQGEHVTKSHASEEPKRRNVTMQSQFEEPLISDLDSEKNQVSAGKVRYRQKSKNK